MKEQFDLFPGGPEKTERLAGLPLSQHGVLSTAREQELVQMLRSTGRYLILERLKPRPLVTAARPGFTLTGAIIDTETTGLRHERDEIIEFGAVSFTFSESGQIGDVTGVYGGLRQPSVPIPADITRLTGITDELVAGQMIDLAPLHAVVDPADLVIAHNARFDRPFCEAFSSIFAAKAWACSQSEIDWRARGFEGTKLGYLVNQTGYFHDGHRAIDDCFALLEVLAPAAQTPENTPLFELYQASRRNCVRILAENSPFDMKDHLKARGYRWSDGSDGRPKSWWVELPEEALESELSYLRSEIYRWEDADPPVRHLSAADRFKA